MNIQDINPQFISITSLRRDIDALERILEKEGKAYVIKNNKIQYVITRPDKNEHFRTRAMNEALQIMESVSQHYRSGKAKGADYVISMRDERIKKWKK